MGSINTFTQKMKNWGYYYCDLAGCEILGIGEDSEVKGKSVYPSGGDWIVHDRRCWSGTYGYDHESAEICKVTIKEPSQHGVDYKKENVSRSVDAMTLMYRYQWIADLFINWAHRLEVSPFGIWDDADAISKDYDSEKSSLASDPHLALYWLLHLGLSLDSRYVEVKQIAEVNRLDEQLEFIATTIEFFEVTDENYNLQIGKEDSFNDIFLIRRAYLIYITQSQSYRGGDCLENWWKSIAIYPEAEKNIVKRVRWLKNNLQNYNRWDDFDSLDKGQNHEVCLLSYVYACNPNTKDRGQYADAFLGELIGNRSLWKDRYIKKFVQIMIWDVREWVSDLALLRESVNIYFENDTVNQEYEEIMRVFGETNEYLVEVREALERLHDLSEAYNKNKQSKESNKSYFDEIDNILSNKQPEVLFKIVENSKYNVLSRRCFHYLFTHDIPGKKDVLISLFVKCGFSSHDIPKLFSEEFPLLIKGENDPNLETAKALLVIPKERFINEYAEKHTREAATMFFLNIAHLPSVFDYLIQLILDREINHITNLKESVFLNIFSEQYDTKINPTHFFSKTQIEVLLQACLDFIIDNISGQNDNPSKAVSDANRSIYYCDHILAKEWIESRLNDKEWFGQFKGIEGFKGELKESLNSALEFIEDAPFNVYMEYKDDNSHKYFEIYYGGESFMVTKGNVGEVGESEDINCDTRKKAQNEVKTLVKKYKENGYIYCTKGFPDQPPSLGRPALL